MKVPFLDFNSVNGQYKKEIMTQIEAIIDGQWFILGERLKSFEANYSKFNQTQYTIGVGNGLDALVIALKALNIKQGDEVIIPSNTFIATALAVSFVGATPVLAEPSAKTSNLDPDAFAKKITKRTKAVMPVHLYGQACEMKKIMKIADENKIFVVEDNAQAQGAKASGRLTGSMGIINGTSFYPGKNLGAFGDAGAITTNSKEHYEACCMYRNYGSVVKYQHDVQGQNSRLDEMQAAILDIKLKNLNQQNDLRTALAEKYNQRLKSISQLTIPGVAEESTHVYHLYVIQAQKRDELQKFLNESQIHTLIHYPIPVHLQKSYAHLNHKQGDFPIAEALSKNSLSLPFFPGMTDQQVDYVVEKIQQFYKK